MIPNEIFDLIKSYQGMTSSNDEVKAFLLDDGYTIQIIETAFEQLRVQSCLSLSEKNFTSQRTSDLRSRIQALFELVPPKEIKECLLSDGISLEEFNDVWREYSTILDPEGRNQYNIGGSAACTSLACSFILAQEVAASAELINKLLNNNDYYGENHLKTDDVIEKFQMKLLDNPLELEDQELSGTMQIGFHQFHMAIQALNSCTGIDGALILGNGITLGMRYKGNYIEIFDSHGDKKTNNVAYIKLFPRDDEDEVVKYLEEKLPDFGAPLVEIYPLVCP